MVSTLLCAWNAIVPQSWFHHVIGIESHLERYNMVCQLAGPYPVFYSSSPETAPSLHGSWTPPPYIEICWHLILARYRVKGFSAWESFTTSSGITLIFRLSPFDIISVAEVVLQVTKFSVLSAYRPTTPSKWPQMKEHSKGIVFVSSRQLIFIYESS